MPKVLGGIFLIVGVSIGAGILALPITTATSGFFPAAALLLFCWLLMTFNAFLILEVNLRSPINSNIITMAKSTLGGSGRVVAWFSYCLLLYALLSAYIAAGTDVLDNLIMGSHHDFFHRLNTIVFCGLLGFIVTRGTSSVDLLNRGLILIKVIAFLFLLFLVAPHVTIAHLSHSDANSLASTLMVVITAFGFAIIVPSMRAYYHSDVKKIRTVILVGSLIPLVFYLVWIFVILGALPLEGENGLRHVLQSGRATSELIIAINSAIQSHWVNIAAKVFSAICVTTSFLGVALSLSDFLADGFSWKKEGKGNLKIYGLTFLPPLIIVLFYPHIFIKALAYAGTLCVILLALLPGLMAWNGRYKREADSEYQVMGGKPLLSLSLIVTVIVFAIGVYQEILM